MCKPCSFCQGSSPRVGQDKCEVNFLSSSAAFDAAWDKPLSRLFRKPDMLELCRINFFEDFQGPEIRLNWGS